MLTKTCSTTITQPDFETNRELILNLDPLVGDTACHLRTAYLLYLYKKPTPLTPEEFAFLNDCAKLPTFSVLDDFGFVLKQTGSKGKVANSKVNVAEQSIAFLLENIPQDFYKEEEEYFKKNYIEFVKHLIPVLPLYLSLKMLIYFLIKNKIPIIVNLKRIGITEAQEETQYKLLGASTLLYEYNEKSRQFFCVSSESSNSIVGVKFDLYSTLSKSGNQFASFPDFFDRINYDDFLEEFKLLSIDRVILICAAAHCQFPRSIIQKYSENSPKIVSQFFIPSKQNIFDLEIDPNKCSIKEFNNVLEVGKAYGLMSPSSMMIQAGKGGVTRTTRSIPFMVDHTRLSTFKQAFRETEELFSKKPELTVPTRVSDVGVRL